MLVGSIELEVGLARARAAKMEASSAESVFLSASKVRQESQNEAEAGFIVFIAYICVLFQ